MKRNQRGFALILVIVVTVALIAIAIPFAISMRHQERGAKGTADRAQTRYAATAARNHALARALRGHENLEEVKGAISPFNTPHVDTLDEFLVDWSPLASSAPEARRGGVLQDEQAKINVRSAPDKVVQNLKSRVDERTCDIRDYLTEFSQRPSAWVGGKTIRLAAPKGAGIGVFVDDPSGFSEFTRVRISANAFYYGLITDVDDLSGEITITTTLDAGSAPGALLEAECRHPININTASRVVIASCLEGLALRNKSTEDTVTKDQANLLATEMTKQKFTTLEEFTKWLSLERGKNTISDNDETAILINFTNPSARALEGTGTMPFILHSSEYVTVAAHGVQELPSGAVGAECDLREVVELAPAGLLRWRVKSQWDFERMIRLPLGNGVMSWPACVAAREVPSQDRGTPAWVTMVTGRDTRANWQVQNHYDPWQMGQKMKGAMGFRSQQVFRIQPPDVDLPAGAVEMWIRTTSTAFTVLDATGAEFDNRIWLSYQYDSQAGGNVIKLVVKDSTLEHTYAQVTYPVTLQADRWYHIGGFWKGTKPGHMMLTLDGIPFGQYSIVVQAGHTTLTTGTVLSTTLGTALTSTPATPLGTDTVVCTSTVAGFPVPGVIEIGNEVIEYTAVSGNTFTGCTRGARGTWPAKAHAAGVNVIVWGYKNLLANGTVVLQNGTNTWGPMVWDRLTQGGGTLAEQIGDVTEDQYPMPAGNPLSPVLVQGATSISLPNVTLANNFPTRGWLLIGPQGPPNAQHEVVAYTGRSGPTFTGVSRGQFGTTDRDHFGMEWISLWGFYVTTNANYLSPTILQIDDLNSELIGPVMKEGTDAWHGLLSTNNPPVPFPLLRRGHQTAQFAGGSLTTSNSLHLAGAPIMPTFALASTASGPFDTITLVEQDPSTRQEMIIRSARWLPPFNPPTNLTILATPFLLTGLNGQVLKDWVPDNLWVRALKFPSGELPGADATAVTLGGSPIPGANLALAGWIDEVRMTSGPKDANFILVAPVDASITTIPILDIGGMSPAGGAILCGDELIGYAGVDAATNTLINCTRGYLGTIARVHDTGDRVFNMAFLAISSLSGSIGPDDKRVPLNSVNNFPPDGYALIGTELVGYTNLGNNELVMPDGTNFRGAFGTTPAPHNPNDLAYAFPFRYYDRFTPQSDDSLNYSFCASFRATGARWRRVTWEERLPNNSLDIRVNLRFNGEPRWTMPANNKPYLQGKGGIWVFNAPSGGSLAQARGDQVEVKVDFVWLDNAYLNGEWKETPELRGITIEYEQDPTIHYHEEK